MTQVQTMTNPELNRKIAELMGYKVRQTVPGGNGRTFYELVRPSGKVDLPTISEEWAYAYGPDYCTDPAASLEVQTAAIKADARKYGINLAKRLKWEEDDLEYRDNDVFSYTGVTIFLLASPRERAEAAYITLQGGRT